MKAIWLKAHPKFSYFADDVCDLSKEQFAELSKTKHVKTYTPETKEIGTSDLPEDLPGRAALINNNILLMADVKEISDFTQIKGIGKSIAAEIKEFLNS